MTAALRTSLLVSVLPLLPVVALAAGPPVTFDSPAITPFTGRSLVIRDFDGVSGPDLAGVNGSNVLISLRQPGGSFAAAQSIAMGTTLTKLASADLDADGRPDLVTISNGSSALESRRNLGGMSFTAVASVPLGGAPTSLALGDLNGDNRPDAVVALPASGQIVVCFNDGAGNLLAPVVLPVGGAPWFVAIGDFTGDGEADIVSVSRSNAVDIRVIPGDGAGNLGAAIPSSQSLSYRFAIAAGDIDGDGDLDLAAYDYDGMSWLPNLGDGTFGAPIATSLPTGSYGTTYDPNSFVLDDLDGDGDLDMAVPMRLARTAFDFQVLASLINKGNGTFFPSVYHHVGIQPSDAAVADLDGDGRKDVVVLTSSNMECCISGMPVAPNFAYLLRGHGNGTFFAHVEFGAHAWMPVRRPAGPVDLVGSFAGRLVRTRNLGDGRFDAPEDLGRGEPWRSVDLNGDHDDEWIVTSSDSLWVLLALGGGAYGPPGSIQPGLVPRDLADVDGDATLDLIASDASLNVKVCFGDGAGGFGPPVDASYLLPPDLFDQMVRATDVNGDTHADLLFTPRLGERDLVGPGSQSIYRTWLHVALGDGAGHFAPADSFALQTVPLSSGTTATGRLSIGDFDGDQVPDVAIQSSGCGDDVQGWWGVLRGLGSGVFTPFADGISAGNSPCGLAAGDLNGDGLSDVVRSNGSGGQTMSVTAFTADDGGVLNATTAGNMGDYPYSVFLADVDGDGMPDVITPSARFLTVSIRRNSTLPSTPVPSLLSLASAFLRGGAVVLDAYAADPPASATLERRSDADDWSTLATLLPDGSWHFAYVDGALPAAARVGYRLRWSDADGDHFTAAMWVELAGADFALRGAWPNPSESSPLFALELPRAGDVAIEVFDVNGRRVAHEHREGLAAGPQRIGLAARLPVGSYVARVRFAGRSLESRFVVVR